MSEPGRTPSSTDEAMQETAKVTTSGGGGIVQHWQLVIDGKFIADTSAPHTAAHFRSIADRLNEAARRDA